MAQADSPLLSVVAAIRGLYWTILNVRIWNEANFADPIAYICFFRTNQRFMVSQPWPWDPWGPRSIGYFWKKKEITYTRFISLNIVSFLMITNLYALFCFFFMEHIYGPEYFGKNRFVLPHLHLYKCRKYWLLLHKVDATFCQASRFEAHSFLLSSIYFLIVRRRSHSIIIVPSLLQKVVCSGYNVKLRVTNRVVLIAELAGSSSVHVYDT